jgi:hypothetical protein
MASRVAELAYAEAVRAVTDQESSLSDIRARAGTVFATGGISSSFLAGAAFQHYRGVPWPALVALLLGLASFACALVALWPRTWLFVNKPDELANDEWAALEDDAALRLAATYIADNLKTNDTTLTLLWKVVEAGMGMLGASIVFWFIALARG